MTFRLTRRSVIAVTLFGLLFSVGTGDAADPPAFHWVNDSKGRTADLLFGDQPVLRYMYAYDASTPERREETYKVYHHVFGPGSKNLITKGPGGKFPHHRGLFCAWRKTEADGKSFDFWHCNHGEQQRHAKFIEMNGDANSGTMTAEIHWNDADGKPVVTELRTVTVKKTSADNGSKYGWQIDWSTSLSSNRGTITLDGDRQHAGFQFRAAQAVADADSARYIRPAGFPDDPKAYEVEDAKNPEKHNDLGWLAMTYPFDGQQCTVEYFEDPSLPKPSHYSERPYGRFGAFFKTQLEPDHPMRLRYRVMVTAGSSPKRESIQSRYDAFVKELKQKS